MAIYLCLLPLARALIKSAVRATHTHNFLAVAKGEGYKGVGFGGLVAAAGNSLGGLIKGKSQINWVLDTMHYGQSEKCCLDQGHQTQPSTLAIKCAQKGAWLDHKTVTHISTHIAIKCERAAKIVLLILQPVLLCGPRPKGHKNMNAVKKS